MPCTIEVACIIVKVRVFLITDGYLNGEKALPEIVFFSYLCPEDDHRLRFHAGNDGNFFSMAHDGKRMLLLGDISESISIELY